MLGVPPRVHDIDLGIGQDALDAVINLLGCHHDCTFYDEEAGSPSQ
jgi:hypothetical protein